MSSSTPSQSFLTYKSADIYFIFSFLCEFRDNYANVVDRLAKSDWQEGTPEDRRGRPPFLDIKRKRGPGSYQSPALYKVVFRDPCATLHFRDSQRDIVIEAIARVADNGGGCVTFRVSLEDEADFQGIQHVLSMSQRQFERNDTVARVEVSGEAEWLFSGGATASFHGDLHGLFLHVIRNMVEAANESDASDDEALEGAAPLVKLVDDEVMDLDDQQIAAQNPYVLSVVELDGNSHPDFSFDESADESERIKELATILFRLVYPANFYADLRDNLRYTRIPHSQQNINGQLRNFAWDARLMMSFSETSSLFACMDKNQIPAKIVRNSLLNTLEILRVRWHMSILINAQLDEDLENFNIAVTEDNIRALLTLIKRRTRFASFLHDPLPYIFEGGSASQLAKYASEEMQLPLLREMTIEKFDVLDRLHADQTKFVNLSEYDDYMELMRSLKEEGR